MPFRSDIRALAFASLGTASLAGYAFAQAPAPRPGVSIQYAQIGGAAGGLEGRAQLPTTPAWVEVDRGPSACENGQRVTLAAKARSGQVREVRVVVNANAAGEIPLGGTGCPSASIEATLEDGRVLTGSDGALTIRQLSTTTGPVLDATFSWTPTLDGHPLLMRGIVFAPPSAPR